MGDPLPWWKETAAVAAFARLSRHRARWTGAGRPRLPAGRVAGAGPRWRNCPGPRDGRGNRILCRWGVRRLPSRATSPIRKPRMQERSPGGEQVPVDLAGALPAADRSAGAPEWEMRFRPPRDSPADPGPGAAAAVGAAVAAAAAITRGPASLAPKEPAISSCTCSIARPARTDIRAGR